MKKKMYSFRLNKDLIDKAKIVAKKMDITLSLLISYSIKEKLNSLKNDDNSGQFTITNKNNLGNLETIAKEIEKLRLDLKSIFGK